MAKEKNFCNLSISVQELDFDIQYEIDNIKRRKKRSSGRNYNRGITYFIMEQPIIMTEALCISLRSGQ